MKEVADGVWQLNTFPLPNSVNAYLVGDVLVDAGGRRAGKSILRDLEGHSVTAHALTHVHADHQGSSDEICTRLGVPFWVPESEVALAEDAELIPTSYPDTLLAKFFIRVFIGPGHKVDRPLREGDDVAGFKVLDTPGHSPGQISLWRESDRVLIAADVLNNMDVVTGIPGLREPKKALTVDPARNRGSIKRLGELEPSVALFGHGGPLRDTKKFVDFCAKVPT